VTKKSRLEKTPIRTMTKRQKKSTAKRAANG